MTDEAESDEDESLLKSQLYVLLIIFGSVALVVVIYHLVKITWIRRRYRAARQPPPLISSRDQPSGGQENSTVEAIPAHKFRKGEVTGKDGGTCAVCLCDFEDGDEVRTLPECVHSFHAACIDMWLYSHSSCPVCRTVAVPPPHTPAVRHGSSVVPELLNV